MWTKCVARNRREIVRRFRSFSSSESNDQASRVESYIDEWFRSIVKPQAFYDQHAEAEPVRFYFFNVDLQGRLFGEDYFPKNIATSIKDTKFLDFFFRQVRRARPQDVEMMKERQIPVDDYPFVAPCGKELNLIRPAATPLVFHSLQDDDTNLVYGGSLLQPFDEQQLAISKVTGRLYHRLQQSPWFQDDENEQYQLIRSAVAVSLSDRIHVFDDDSSLSDDCSGMGILTKSGDLVPIPSLPNESEPGSWAMPFHADAPEG